MYFYPLILKNIFNFPLLCFLIGIFLAFIQPRLRLPPRINKLLTLYILFCIGLKGGGSLAEHYTSSAILFSIILGALILWGLLSPLLSFYLLKSFTRVDCVTAAAIAASFGSVSVMTFTTALSFLDQLKVSYQEFIIAALALMEIPAIISGICLAKIFDKSQSNRSSNVIKLLREALLNKAIGAIVIGLITGVIFYSNQFIEITENLLLTFKPLLCLFLFDMGLNVSIQRHHFLSFSWSLNLFGIYMPLIGGGFGLILSYILKLDVGTATLIAVLAASASYIAVPAALRIALPEAKEAIYLPLSLGIAFPFNIILGIPLYYYLAIGLLR
jgi:hypothetical protein